MNSRKIWFLVVVFVFFGGACFLFKESGLARLKAWRFDKSVAEAEVALVQEDYNEVARMTGAAWRLSTGSLQELRVLFQLATDCGSPDSSSIGDELFSHSQAGFEDRLAVIKFVSRSQNTLYLEGLLGRLTEEERQQSGVVAIRVKKLLREGNRLESLVLMERLAGEVDESPELKLLKCQLLVGERGNPLAWQDCRKGVHELMITEGAQSLPAFRVLNGLPELELAKVKEPNLTLWLQEQSEAQVADYLLAANWELLQDPVKEEEVVTRIIGLGQEDPNAVARWLVSQGQSERILAEEDDLSSSETFPFYLAKLQVYLNAEQWEQASELLAKPHQAMVGSLLYSFRAGIAYLQGDEVARITNLQEALRRAKSSERYGEFLAIFKMGARLGDNDSQRKACEELVLLPSRLLPGGQELSFLEQQFGGEPEFLANLYQKLEAAKPDDALICYRKALLSFVTGVEEENALHAMNQLLKEYPQASSIQSAVALMMAANSPTEAMTWLREQVDGEPSYRGAFENAVYACLLRANGNVQRAKQLESTVAWDSIPLYVVTYFEQKGAQVTL